MSTAVALRSRQAPAELRPDRGERWVRGVASALMLPLALAPEAGRGGAPESRRAPDWPEPPLDAGGLPVLLVGGMGSTPASLRPLHDWLLQLNCRPAISPIRYGIDCGERTTAGVAHALADLTEATGRPAAVVAHSRGGHFARAVTVRHPDLVAGLLTLGSPVNRMLGVHPLLQLEAWMIGLIGSLGVPGLMRVACLFGDCCRMLRDDLFAPFPAEVPFLSMYSRSDRVVDWRSCVTPEARHREVDTTHGGLLHAPAALAAVAEELGRLRSASAA